MVPNLPTAITRITWAPVRVTGLSGNSVGAGHPVLRQLKTVRDLTIEKLLLISIGTRRKGPRVRNLGPNRLLFRSTLMALKASFPLSRVI